MPVEEAGKATDRGEVFMLQPLKWDGLLSQTEAQSQDGERLTRPSAQTRPARFTLLVMQIVRRVTAARHERALPWYHDPSASRGL
jgi:hypothetical protein